jgi:hypothetical protein
MRDIHVALLNETLGFTAQALVILVRHFTPPISCTNRSVSVRMSKNETFSSSGSQYCVKAQPNI